LYVDVYARLRLLECVLIIDQSSLCARRATCMRWKCVKLVRVEPIKTTFGSLKA